MPNDRILHIPQGKSLETLLFEDTPVEFDNIAAFSRLWKTADEGQLRWLCKWIEPQKTVDGILKHHGPEGLNTVLEGIARACAKQKVHMGGRVAAIAGFYQLEIY